MSTTITDFPFIPESGAGTYICSKGLLLWGQLWLKSFSKIIGGFPGSIRRTPAWGPQRRLFRRWLCRSSWISSRTPAATRSISAHLQYLYLRCICIYVVHICFQLQEYTIPALPGAVFPKKGEKRCRLLQSGWEYFCYTGTLLCWYFGEGPAGLARDERGHTWFYGGDDTTRLYFYFYVKMWVRLGGSPCAPGPLVFL